MYQAVKECCGLIDEVLNYTDEIDVYKTKTVVITDQRPNDD